MVIFARLQTMQKHLPSFFSPRMSEWFTTAVLFACGQMLVANPNLMADPNLTALGAYDTLLAIASQEQWSLALRMFAIARVVVLIINGAWSRSPHARAVFAFIACFFWMQLTLAFYEVFGFAFVFAAGWLGIDMMNIMRAARESAFVSSADRDGESGTT